MPRRTRASEATLRAPFWLFESRVSVVEVGLGKIHKNGRLSGYYVVGLCES